MFGSTKRLAAACLAALLFAAAPSAAQAACTWNVGAPPTVPNALTILHAVAPIAAKDEWAVGYSHTSSAGDQALAEHFNGTGWQISALPAITGSRLLGVKAVASNDVWAVGLYKSGGTTLPLAEHWNGLNWHQVAVPPVKGAPETELLAIYAIAWNDVWAVGCAMSSTGTQTLAVTEHWDGTKWSLIPTPEPNAQENVLYTVTANRSNNVWALGNQGKYQSTTNPRRNLALHWDGTSWSVIPTVNAGTASTINYFYASAFIPGTDHLWGVGQYQAPKAFYTMTAYWNGAQWTLVPSPNPAANGDFLLGLFAKGAGDVWSVGTYYDTSMIRHNLAIHWNGTSWSNYVMPNQGSNMNELFDAQPIPGTTAALGAGDFYPTSTTRQPETAFDCAV